MTFEITPGTIYSAPFPFSDLSNKKKRPVLPSGKVIGGEELRAMLEIEVVKAHNIGYFKRFFENWSVNVQRGIKLSPETNSGS